MKYLLLARPSDHPRSRIATALAILGLISIASGPALAATATPTTTAVDLDHNGRAELRSVGPLAFGPSGILFVADSLGASVFAIDTADSGKLEQPLEITGLDEKIAALVGTTRDQIRIHDLAVHPETGRAYFSITRGQGDGAVPLLVRVSSGSQIEVLSLDKVRYSQARLANAPDPDAKGRRGDSLRLEAITDLEYSNGQLLVTGLSNEEFSSKLRNIAFPFKDVGAGTSVEIYHGAHGGFETHAPVRTLTTYDIEDTSHVLAAYTCTPLVAFPMTELVDRAKVTGRTVAELGNRNRPLDMFVYRQQGKDYLLMANSARGVMKVDLASIADVEGITERIADTAGLPYQTIEGWTGVQQLERAGDAHALMLVDSGSGLDLKTAALP